MNNFSFLPKPNFQRGLPYATVQKKIYVNLFEFDFQKDMKIYQYPYKVEPAIAVENQAIRDKLEKYALRSLRNFYGECFFSGDSMYSQKKIEEMKVFNVTVYHNFKRNDYEITFQGFINEVTVRRADIRQNPLAKQCAELMLRDVLHSNQNLDFYRELMVDIEQRKKINTERISVDFYPGFITSFMKLEKGNFLNVTLKNKILSRETIYEYLKGMNFKDRRSQDILNKSITERTFKTRYSNRNYRIEKIDFERTPKNTTFNRDGATTNLINYYKVAHGLTISDPNQPLILVYRKGPQDTEIPLYFVPEFCYFTGLDDVAIKDGKFMKELANYTKLNPNERVRKTESFLGLLNDKEGRVVKQKEGNVVKLKSSFEKKQSYGFELKPTKEDFKAYFIKPVRFLGKNGKEVSLKDRVFPVKNAIKMTNWLCLYDKRNYDDAEVLFNTLSKASKGYHFQIDEPEWVEMDPQSANRAEDWTGTVDEYFKSKSYKFVLFLLDRNDRIYPELKKHSLTSRGYYSQVVKTLSLRKNAMSVCSKILHQLNAKMGGCSYSIDFSDEVSSLKLMLVGVDSSHLQGKKTGVAMVSTLDEDFCCFYNKESIINEKNNKEVLQYCVSEFLMEATREYFKRNKNLPGGIIIYRQGVSIQQKEYLQLEINNIKKFCDGEDKSGLLKGKPTPFYYILVNTKTTYKFFETDKKGYANPAPGLLVTDGVTNPDFFEFYIQPQEVTGGSATPTCYHVAYGNLNKPEMIPRLTFELCHTYANWQGPVRVPNVLKAAEKLSKMTAKSTRGALNENLIIGQAYL